MARRRFFVAEVREGRAELAGDEAHHLTRVLRVESGQRFEISDNRAVYLAEVKDVRKDRVTFAVLEPIASPEPLVNVTLYASLIRFERFETILEKATELGVERITPVQAERSEKGLEAAAGGRMARWNRIVREASEQSRRTRMTAIDPAVRLPAVNETSGGAKYALDEDPEAPPLLRALYCPRVPGARVALLAGPEGGWTERERTWMRETGWQPVSLGRTILKTETALIGALSIVNAAWLAELGPTED